MPLLWLGIGEQQRREDEEREARKMLDLAIQKQDEEVPKRTLSP